MRANLVFDDGTTVPVDVVPKKEKTAGSCDGCVLNSDALTCPRPAALRIGPHGAMNCIMIYKVRACRE